jgi:predicted Ser/Thr protein kinase
MDITHLDKWIKKIKVRNMINADVEVVNRSPLMMIGKGRQGAVFQISEDVCVKVFGNMEDCEREYHALSLGQHTHLLPRIFAKGPLYIAMEMVKGVDLREYLQSQPLTRELSHKLIKMLITFKKIGFERIDHHKRQIFLQPDGNLKVIDVGRTVWRDRVYPYPRKLLTSLGEENKQLFLTHVQKMAPKLYKEWKYYMRMEEISRQLYQVLLKHPPEIDKLRKQIQILLTTNDKEKHINQLENLVRKVFKEEWIKTMLAQGYAPEEVMKKIDEYIERKRKNNVSET